MAENVFKSKTKNFTAYVQVLPSVKPCWEDVKLNENNKNVYVRCTQDFGKGKNINIPNYYVFRSDGILYKLNQDEIYVTITAETLNKAILGTDVLIFAYGQTGSGKSSTISGLQNPYEARGLIPRIITELFELKEKYKHESKIKYKVSFVDVTRTSLVNLLTSDNDKNLSSIMKNVQVLKLKSQHDGLKYLFEGEGNREFRHNSTYASHLFTSVFTIHVVNRSTVLSNPIDRFAKIHILDMAGIDSSGNESCAWKSSREVGVANLNKSQLELCLMLMRANLVKDKKFIKDAGILMDYLGDSLKPQSIIKFIAHIKTDRNDLRVTISTLKFANTARSIHCTGIKQFAAQSSDLVMKNLKTEVVNLQKQRDLDAMLLNKALSYNITQSRIDQMKNAVDDYIHDKSNELCLQSVIDISTVLNIMKSKCITLENEKTDILKLQSLKKSTLAQKISKDSTTTLFVSPEKSSKITHTASYDSQASRRKKSSVKLVRRSKQNSSVEIKSSLVGTTTRSGISMGKLMSHNYQGSVTKSLKRKSKIMKNSSKDTVILNKVSSPENTESKIELTCVLENDFEKTWDSYKVDENYNFIDMDNKLKSLEEVTREILEQYNEITKKLEGISHAIDLKKNDLLKIQLYKATTNPQCKSNEPTKINETEEDIKSKISSLNEENSKLREKLLTIQTEIKINSEDYRRIKNNINEEFKKFSIDKYKVHIPVMQPNSECIEDKILLEALDNADVNHSKANTQEADIYYKLQEKLMGVQQQRRNQQCDN